jgi:hypothetical protein
VAAGTVEAVLLMAPHCARGMTERPIGHPSAELDSQRRSGRRLFLRSTRRLCLKPGTDVKVRREQALSTRVASRTRGSARTDRPTTNTSSWYPGGPEVHGPGEALLIAMAARPDALDDLSGPGLRILAQRIRG